MSLNNSFFESVVSQYSFNPNHLQIIDRTVGLALSRFNRVCGLRFDLRFPDHQLYRDPAVISRFIDSFKAHLRAWDNQRRSEHPIGFGYIWCKEQHNSQNWHYHLVFLFNKDAICGFGRTSFDDSSTYTRIRSAWASALGVRTEQASGLVHICKHGVYWIDKNSERYPEEYASAMNRFSYLAKYETKPFGDGMRNFGACRQLFMSGRALAIGARARVTHP